MLKRILVPLDNSKYCQYTVEVAIETAKQTGANLTGLGIIDEPAINKPEATPIGASEFSEHKQEALLREARETVQRLLREFEQRCKKANVTAHSRKRIGVPHEEICNESHRHDLLLLGHVSHFKFMTQRTPCETCEKVIRDNPRPIILVPDSPPKNDEVFLANDGSSGAAKAVQMFQLMGLGTGKKIRIVSVDEDKAKAKHLCEEVEEYLNSHYMDAHVDPIETSDRPHRVLKDLVMAQKPSLVVMGAYGESGIKEFFFGSATRELLKHPPAPLFIFH